MFRPPHFATVVLLLTAVLGLGACGSRPEEPGPPTVMDTPLIVWQDGIEPNSSLEDHPLVKAARAGDLGISLARNTGDFTIAQLTDHVSNSIIDNLAKRYSSQGNHPYVNPGPPSWQPIRIVEETDDGGIIEVCGLLNTGLKWHIERGVRGGEYSRERAYLYKISLKWDDGHLKYFASFDRKMMDSCDGSQVPVGFFEPRPVLPEIPVTEPVRLPLPTPTSTPTPSGS